MVRRYQGRQIARLGPRPQRMWLEVAGQRRLRRLHQRLQARREAVERLTTFLDDVDARVREQLEDIGDEASAYDTAAPDVMRPFRGHEELAQGHEARARARRRPAARGTRRTGTRRTGTRGG